MSDVLPKGWDERFANEPLDPIGNKINHKVEERRIEEAKAPLAKIVTASYSHGEAPIDVTFQHLITYHDRTPQIQIAVSAYSELITGTDMTIKCKTEPAQKVIDDWVRKTDFYRKFESLVTTCLITGNAILEKLDENMIDDIEEVDMSTIIKKKRDEFGELQWYEHRTNNGQTTKLGEGKIGKFIEFNLTNYSKQPWGRSIFYSLAIPRVVGNRTTAPLVEIMWGIEDAMSAILLNNAYPITTITYPGASDDYLKKEATRWGIYKPGDKRVQKIKPDIEFFEAEGGSGRYQFLVEHIEKTFELGTQFPHDIMTGDFTSRASSETTETIVMKKVRGYQHYLCNKLKTELFDNILIQNGFEPDDEELECTFTTQNIIELTPDQVKDRVSVGQWTKNEGREWDRTNLGVELPDDDVIQQDEQDQKDMDNKAMDNKAKDVKKLESQVEKLIITHNMEKEHVKLKERMQDKLSLISRAMKEDKETLANTRIRALEKIIEKVEALG